MASQHPLFFTIVWLLFSLLWAGKAIISRWKRKYSESKTSANRNNWFKPISYIVFIAQLTFVPYLLWFNSSGLLTFHNSDFLRLVGLMLCFVGLGIYALALKFLGRNYSPCFDSHLPFEIIQAGPYKIIRHPTWLAKILVSVGSVLLGGSVWLLPILLWIFVEMKRTVRGEEADLIAQFPEYQDYKNRTSAILPYVL